MKIQKKNRYDYNSYLFIVVFNKKFLLLCEDDIRYNKE